MAGDQIHREEKAKCEKRAGRQHHPGPAKPVAEIAPERPRLRGSWSFRHRSNYLRLDPKVTLKQRVNSNLRTSSLAISRRLCRSDSSHTPEHLWRSLSAYFFNERMYATSALMSASESLLPNGFMVSFPFVFTPSLIALSASASLNAACTLASW